MATSVQTPVESGETNYTADRVADDVTWEPGKSKSTRQRPRRGALVFVAGFMLGAVATTAARLVGRERMPFVLGNRNVLVSLPFSGISFSAPSVRSTRRGRGRARRPNGLAAVYSTVRSKRHMR
jgi:hypothetical protein